MSQNFETCYSTLSNMKAYEGECQNFYAYFIQFSFLLPTCLSSDNNFRVSQGMLQALDSAAVLYGDHFKLHFNTALVPPVVKRLNDAKQPIRDAARRFLLMQVFTPTIIVKRAWSYAWSHKNWRVREEFTQTITSAITLLPSAAMPSKPPTSESFLIGL